MRDGAVREQRIDDGHRQPCRPLIIIIDRLETGYLTKKSFLHPVLLVRMTSAVAHFGTGVFKKERARFKRFLAFRPPDRELLPHLIPIVSPDREHAYSHDREGGLLQAADITAPLRRTVLPSPD